MGLLTLANYNGDENDNENENENGDDNENGNENGDENGVDNVDRNYRAADGIVSLSPLNSSYPYLLYFS